MCDNKGGEGGGLRSNGLDSRTSAHGINTRHQHTASHDVNTQHHHAKGTAVGNPQTTRQRKNKEINKINHIPALSTDWGCQLATFPIATTATLATTAMRTPTAVLAAKWLTLHGLTERQWEMGRGERGGVT